MGNTAIILTQYQFTKTSSDLAQVQVESEKLFFLSLL